MIQYTIDYGISKTIQYSQNAAVGNISVSFTDLTYGDSVHTISSLAPQYTGSYVITFPAVKNIVDRDMTMTVVYTNSSSQQITESFNVKFRRPYVKTSQIASELGLTIVGEPEASNEVTRAKLEQYEAYAFERINAITNNYFNKTFNRSIFYGNGTDSIAIDSPVSSIEKVWNNDELYYDKEGPTYPVGLNYVTGDDKRNIFVKDVSGASITRDPYGYVYPEYRYPVFNKDNRYKIQFISGYEEIPQAIYQATILIINEYMCSEYGQRNHYVVNQDTPFGKVQYDPRAFNGFGNVSIDQLLQPYLRLSMQVI